MPALSPGAERALERALRSDPGREVVGFLLADDEREDTWFWRLRNYGEQPGIFALDPADVSRVERAAPRRGQRIVAFVHSHESGLARSAADRASQRLVGLPWVIVCLAGDELRHRLYPPPPRRATCR